VKTGREHGDRGSARRAEARDSLEWVAVIPNGVPAPQLGNSPAGPRKFGFVLSHDLVVDYALPFGPRAGACRGFSGLVDLTMSESRIQSFQTSVSNERFTS
jgi:hypothetical protein